MIRDVNALLSRYQGEVATLTTRALVAEQEAAEARDAFAALSAEMTEVRERLATLEAPETDADVVALRPAPESD